MKKSYHHGDLRQSLITLTLHMLAQHEGHLIGFRELARRLEVSRSAPYRHFESVDHLLSVVVEEGFGKLLAALEASVQSPQLQASERFVELGVAYVHFALDHAAYYQLMFDPRFFVKGQYPEIRKLSKQCFKLLRASAAECSAADASADEHTHLANMAWAAVHGMARLFIDGQWHHMKQRKSFIQESCEKFLQAFATKSAGA